MTITPVEKKRSKLSWLKRSLIALGGVFLLYRMACAYAPTDFLIHRRFYFGVVGQVKAKNLKIGDTKTWLIRKSQIGWTLIPHEPSMNNRSLTGLVCARRDVNGYTISIISNDGGHFGYYGYIFSDGPLKATGDSYIQIDVPGDFAEVTHQLNDHWCAAKNNLG
ncbi:hypothetical protein EON80_16615 [bacterium]|nr:MAG: hypothetical protein EON80_16615 [bacterium]